MPRLALFQRHRAPASTPPSDIGVQTDALDEAMLDADTIRSRARSDAARLVHDAQGRATHVINRASAQATEITAQADARSRETQCKVEQMVDKAKARVEQLALDAEEIASHVTNKLGTADARRMKVLVGDRTFQFSAASLNRIRGTALYHMLLNPNFKQVDGALDLPDELPEVFTYIHRFVQSRTGAAMGLKSLSTAELGEVSAAARYFLTGSSGHALQRFQAQVQTVTAANKPTATAESPPEAIKVFSAEHRYQLEQELNEFLRQTGVHPIDVSMGVADRISNHGRTKTTFAATVRYPIRD